MGTDTYRYGDFDERVRSITHSVGLIIGAFAVGIIFTLAGFSVAGLFGLTYETVSDIPASIQAFGNALQFVGFIAVGWLYLQWYDSDRSLFDLSGPSLRDIGWVIAGIVSLLVVLNVLGAALQQFGIEAAANEAITQGERQPVYLLYLIPVTLLFVAPAEELIFRGLVQGLFRRAYGVLPGVVIASALFGVSHYLALGGQGSKFAYLAVAAVLGLLLGLLYERTQNLLVPILVHGVYNAVIFYLQYLRVTGQVAA
ncbi:MULTISPECIES: CPBP family intramembrane glutamic endopeptidase [Salinibaculum]|uniref:CPBP family intramembrane glutamic endopeptidase n=1 Tax=Salinibaculum TaxID=2732368 RepID=UPI0030CA7CC8